MKELTIEEKAARYDETLAKAKRYYNEYKTHDNILYIEDMEDMEDMFPELKESEDELHRKWILEYLYDGLRKSDEEFKDHFKAAIAWLEKQGEQKYVEKVEPKFKSGDWIIDEQDGVILHINKVLEHAYEVTNLEGGSYEASRCSIETCNRLWTIQDAKDGDVLAYPDGSITLFNYLFENIYMAHVLWVDGHIELNNSCAIFNVHPATKEQRDLLFSKMKEAGYEWDAEKKELKKVEKKLVEWHREDEQNLNVCLSYIPDEFLRRWLTDTIHVKYDKTAWSEEDANRFRNLIYLVEHSDEGSGTKRGFIKFINRLKSLKERYTWKPSDEQIRPLEYAIDYFKKKKNDTTYLESLYQDLKKLREK